MRNRILLSTVLVLFLLSGARAEAQEPPPVAAAPRYWASLGGGLSSFGPSFAVSAYGQREKKLLEVRYVYDTEFIILGPKPTEHVGELGVLIGVSRDLKYGGLSCGIGLGVVGGVERGQYLYKEAEGLLSPSVYEEKHWYAFGIPLEMQVSLRPSRFVGIALQAYADLNLRAPVAGVLLSIQVGQVR